MNQSIQIEHYYYNIKVKKSAGSNRQILGSNSIVMVHLEEIKDLQVLVAL